MPRKPNFTQEELEDFKKRLLILREKIIKGIENIEGDVLNKSQKESTGDLSGYSFHMADVATDSFDTEFQINMASNGQNLLNDIDSALKKIEEGTYGICEKYGTPIPKGRLKVMPYARLSIKAQEEEEKDKKNH
ncbi:MAG: TraR/DksA C4-type zinc finger protein [Candidatus Omnitrophica bacterium]|nr:TraR/DksA C4-type zinc finger protein [Candidatus Omnitrophota bacterium]